MFRVTVLTVIIIFFPFQVNISSSWLLPQNEFPVFYRHFRDKVTWFEADAVCQFHHAQLVTGKWLFHNIVIILL